MSASSIISVAAQVGDIRFSQRAKSAKAKGPNFDVQLNRKNPAGRNPCCIVHNAKLGLWGRPSEGNRGLKVVEYTMNGTNNTAMFSTLTLALDRSRHTEVYEMCRAVLAKWVEKHDPVRKSMWYQNHFPQLTDGTKVHRACRALLTNDLYIDQEFDGPEQYDSPGRTYGEFLFGNDEECKPWYCDVRVSEGFPAKDDRLATEYTISFFDERGKQCGDKTEGGMTVYKKGGIPLMSPKMLKVLTQSEFYKGTYWNCCTIMQLYAMEMRCVETDDGGHCIFPVFQFRTNNSLCFQASLPERVAEGSITFEQRNAIFHSAIFDGVSNPVKKRKRSTSVKGANATTPKVSGVVDAAAIESENTIVEQIEPISVRA